MVRVAIATERVVFCPHAQVDALGKDELLLVGFEGAADFAQLEVGAAAARGPEAIFDRAIAGDDEDHPLWEERCGA